MRQPDTENLGSHIISTFGGMGKTYFAGNYPELAIDLEAVPYKYIYEQPEHLEALKDGRHEALKSVSERVDNPLFPDNYVQEIVRNLGKYSFIFIVLSPETLLKLEMLNVEYSLVYPDDSATEALLERMKQRGNNDTFLTKINTLLSTNEEKDYLSKTLKPLQFFTLGQSEYLEDLIRREFSADFGGGEADAALDENLPNEA